LIELEVSFKTIK